MGLWVITSIFLISNTVIFPSISRELLINIMIIEFVIVVSFIFVWVLNELSFFVKRNPRQRYKYVSTLRPFFDTSVRFSLILFVVLPTLKNLLVPLPKKTSIIICYADSIGWGVKIFVILVSIPAFFWYYDVSYISFPF